MNIARPHKSKLLRLALAAACAAPLVVLAADRKVGPPSPGGPRLQGGAPGDRPREGNAGDPADHGWMAGDWNLAREFMRENSPNRLNQFKLLPEKSEARERIRHLLIVRYRSLMRLKDDSPKLYETKVQAIRLEDQIFGICREMKEKPAKKDALRQELKPKLAALFDKGVEERQLRIANLEKSLASQNKELKNEQANRDALIDRKFQVVSTHGVEGAEFDVPGLPKRDGQKFKSTDPGAAPPLDGEPSTSPADVTSEAPGATGPVNAAP